MLRVEFEPTFSVSEGVKRVYFLDRATTLIGLFTNKLEKVICNKQIHKRYNSVLNVGIQACFL
jgi:hypothetical protein